MALSEHQVIEALRPVIDPELHVSIIELDMVRAIDIRRGRVAVTVALTVAGCPLRDEITRRVRAALLPLRDVKAVAVNLTVMTPAELDSVRARMQALRGGSQPAAWSSASAPAGPSPAGPSPAGTGAPASGGGGHSHPPQLGAPEGGPPAGSGAPRRPLGHEEGRANAFSDPKTTTRVLGVTSGKGGVGKSSVTVNLAIALKNAGYDVAILDADVYGFSIPGMLGLDADPAVRDEKMIPPEAHGVRCMSIGFFVDEDQPVMWRGPMLHKALEQLLVDVDWGTPDFLLIDMPPGTGDVALSMAQYLPSSEVYVVTTPQAAARRVAQRTAYMAKKLRLPLRGVIENMSWFTGDDGAHYELFGQGGGAQLAAELGVPLLGQVPLVAALREGGDAGLPITVTQPEGEAARAFAAIAAALVARGRGRVFLPELTIR